MSWGNNSIARQLPHMEFVHGQHAVDVLQQPLLDGVHLDMRRHRLQQNKSRVPQQRPHRAKDEQYQHQR